MTILNISLCLPELDVVALSQPSGQGRSIVAVTERFIVPDKSFVLLPCRRLPDSLVESPYRPEVLSSLKQFALPSDDSVMARYWAQCVFCQQIVDEEAIAAISDRTIWKKSALLNHLQTRGKLFLSFLKVYKLLEAKSIDTEPVCGQLYKFLPLPKYLDVSHQKPVLSNNEFAAAKQAILEPAESASDGGNLQNDDKTTPELVEENAANSFDWVSKISEVGNSSDGHTFEKLVRKALIELGFSNSKNKTEISLDPNATGGAGGLDFYADEPYPLVGECKATGKQKVNSNATAQLIVLGMKHLLGDYQHCVKLVVAAGKITNDAHQIAEGHNINVIRPEALQALVELKLKYENSVNLEDLKVYLERPPFSVAANEQLLNFIQQREADYKREAQYFQQARQIVNTVKELSQQPIHKQGKAFTAVEIRAHYNARHQPCVTDEATKETLRELSSPFSGYLGRKQLPEDQERFYFVKDMRTLDA